MYDLYTWSTPNGRKISIMLEELGVDYHVYPVNILQEEQFAADFLKISPNNKIPALYDRDNACSLMESGAILLYLAEKHQRFYAGEENARWQIMQWLMWQMGGFGPMLGQAHHFVHFNPDKSEYAKARFATEAARLYAVLEQRLGEAAYVGGKDYSIADMAIWPWTARYQWQGVELLDYPNVLRWYREIAARPAVQAGYGIPNAAEIPLPA